MYIWRFILFPFAIVYYIVICIRNLFYDHSIFKSTQFEIPTLVVGNLTVGGTGKTPMVEYLIKLFANKYKISTLSRGYGRKTRGFLKADNDSTAYDIADEPLQIYQKLKSIVNVYVGEDRVNAIKNILKKNPQNQLIILDDAYQHRSLKAKVYVLLTDYNRLFYNDLIVPIGLLRERRNEAKRANCIVVTKCPTQLAENDKNRITSKIRFYNSQSPIYFSTIAYKEPTRCFKTIQIETIKNIFLVTGISEPLYLVKHIKSNYCLIDHLAFPDHHEYSMSDVQKILDKFEKNKTEEKIILITEKDLVKLNIKAFNTILESYPIYYISIECEFLSQKENFEEYITKALFG